jgi:hypothetical protein
MVGSGCSRVWRSCCEASKNRLPAVKAEGGIRPSGDVFLPDEHVVLQQVDNLLGRPGGVFSTMLCHNSMQRSS